MKAIFQEIVEGKLTLMQTGSGELAELRRRAWRISNDNSESEATRYYARLVGEACEREFERLDAIEDAEREAEDVRRACQAMAWAA